MCLLIELLANFPYKTGKTCLLYQTLQLRHNVYLGWYSGVKLEHLFITNFMECEIKVKMEISFIQPFPSLY